MQMQAALGVTGMEGGFRQGCQHILRVARQHSTTLSSLLQAILVDPLVAWAPDKQQAGTKKVRPPACSPCACGSVCCNDSTAPAAVWNVFLKLFLSPQCIHRSMPAPDSLLRTAAAMHCFVACLVALQVRLSRGHVKQVTPE